MSEPWVWQLRTRRLSFERPLVMGILNATPDSFSDGGLFLDVEHALARADQLIEQGADVIDVGGESTRPGAAPVDVSEELRRVIPIVERLADRTIVSVDTSKPGVAEAALGAGAEIVNDVTGLRDPAMRTVVAEGSAGAVIMHMQGEPRTMQEDPRYEDVEREVVGFLGRQFSAAVESGSDPLSVVVDPGIGFGKTLEHNLILCNRISRIAELGRPVLIGTSRKRFLGSITGRERADERDLATAVSMAMAVERGAAILRVHDVSSTREALSVVMAIVKEQHVDISSGVRAEPTPYFNS